MGGVEGKIIASRAAAFEVERKVRAEARKAIPDQAWQLDLEELDLPGRIHNLLLDAEIETWMQQQFGTVIDFDIDGPIRYLSKIEAPDVSGQSRPILEVTDTDHLRIAALPEIKQILDYCWDHFFQYSQRYASESNLDEESRA